MKGKKTKNGRRKKRRRPWKMEVLKTKSIVIREGMRTRGPKLTRRQETIARKENMTLNTWRRATLLKNMGNLLIP